MADYKRHHVLLLPSGIEASIIAEELMQTQEEAFFVCDLSDVVRKHRDWTKAMPRIQPHYAVKANDHMPMLKTLVALGTSFDCASKGEIQKVLSLGVAPERIIYANPTKDPEYIRFAAKNGVDLMTFDGAEELHKIKLICPQARLVVRLKCEAQNGRRRMDSKHGCDAKYVPVLLALAHGLGLKVVGVSFHFGCEIFDFSLYREAIAACRRVFEEAAVIGFDLNLLDIGGGFLGTSIEPVADVINKALDEYFPETHVKVISEPGRYFANSAFTLANKIHSIKTVKGPSPEESTRFVYIVNDGVHGNFCLALTESRQYSPTHRKRFETEELHPSSIWGQTLDPIDVISTEIYLPKLNVGDWLTWNNMGAYARCLSRHFNSFPKAGIFNVAEAKHKFFLEDHFLLQTHQRSDLN